LLRHPILRIIAGDMPLQLFHQKAIHFKGQTLRGCWHASFDIPEEDYVRFRAICIARGTTPVKEVRAFIRNQIADPDALRSVALYMPLFRGRQAELKHYAKARN